MRRKSRTKPVTRDEVRIGGSAAYASIETLPVSTVRERGDELEAIPKLWGPLLRELNRAAKEWLESPRGQAHLKWSQEHGYSDPSGTVELPKPSPYLGRCYCRRCGRKFYRAEDSRPRWRLRPGRYCSDRCQRLAQAPARKARRAAFIKARSDDRARARADLKCGHCGEPIEAQRSTMRFCSTRCRVAAHRGRKS
jgi:endogenous inhibitor of DNA gyrase (YacG/DUF329 family)